MLGLNISTLAYACNVLQALKVQLSTVSFSVAALATVQKGKQMVQHANQTLQTKHCHDTKQYTQLDNVAILQTADEIEACIQCLLTLKEGSVKT